MRKKDILLDVLGSAEQKDYKGHSKFDALNSPLLDKLSFNNKWLRLIYTQLVKESPMHIRPLLKVEESRNPKGIALFARAYLFLYEDTQNTIFLAKAEKLLEWLIQNPSPKIKSMAWGYNFVWQSTLFLQKKHEPNTIVSIFVGEAFVHAYRITKKNLYITTACSICNFLLKDVPILFEKKDELAIAYVLKEVRAIVLNNQILAGAFLIKVWKHLKNDQLKHTAKRLINFTVRRRTPYNAWYYTFPFNKSLIVHDNYHTGGILDGLLEYYCETGDDQYMGIYEKGLRYYKENLFEKNGAPRWMNNRKYPFDIHGSAQGIISFAKASQFFPEYETQAQKTLLWTVKHLYNKKASEFIYRQGRFFNWNYSLMRWCNAWMTKALAEYETIQGKKDKNKCF